MSKVFLNPDALPLPNNRAYTQVVIATGTKVIHLSGMLAVSKQRGLIGEGDIAVQVRAAMENAKAALEAAGATFADVVKVTWFVTDIEAYVKHGNPVANAYYEPDRAPASTLVQVVRLVDPRWLCEVEMTAIVDVSPG